MATKITFNNRNQQALSAKLELPTNQQPSAYAIFAHCFTCNKNLNAVRNISKALNQSGFAVLRFDFTGLGESEGEFHETNFSSNVSDLESAAVFLEENYEAPKLIIGHSLGGAAALYAAASIQSIKAVATVGAPSSPAHVQHLFQDGLEKIKTNGIAEVNIGGRPFKVAKEFIENIEQQNLSDTVKALRKPLLVLHSPHDETVGIENAKEIYTAAMHPKSFISLNGADHLLSNTADSIYAGKVIAQWAERYIETEEKAPLKTKNQVTVRNDLKAYTSEIAVGKHQLIADEPKDVGGNDFGPTPYDLLLASVGACTAMTLKMYASRKNWEFEEILVHLDHKKDYASDCEHCEETGAKIDVIDRTVEVKGHVSDDQKQRLLNIANKCPVHKTLENTIEVRTSLKIA